MTPNHTPYAPDVMESIIPNGHESAIQSGSSASSPPGGFADHDRITRQRDVHGNSPPGFYTYNRTWVGDVPLEKSHLKRELELIGEHLPINAQDLMFEYDEKLRLAAIRFDKVIAEEEARRLAANERTEAVNQAVDTHITDLRLKREDALQPWLAERENRARHLAEAQRVAVKKVALTGGLYCPENPCEEDALHIEHRTLAEIAREEQLPDVQHDRDDLLPTWLSWWMTCLVGTLMGISLGIMGGFLSADTLRREWMVAAGFAIAGFGTAAFGRKWIVNLYRHASERSYLRLPARERTVAWAVAHSSALLLLTVDCVVEKEGILKLARQKNAVQILSGPIQQTSEGIFILAALLITLGYVGYSAVEGHIKGRRHGVMNHLLGVQERDYRESLLKRRAQVEVQTALEAISNVKEEQRRFEEVETRLSEVAKPYEGQMAEWEAKRRVWQEELTLEQNRRIQDAHRNLLGAQMDFNNLLEEKREQCEPTWGIWHQILHFISPSVQHRRKTH